MTPPVSALAPRLATAAVLVETLLAWGYVVVIAVDGAGSPGRWRVVGYFALYAVAFAGLAWALIRRRRWVRAPLIVLQLLVFASGLGLSRGDHPVPGVLIMALAVTSLALLLAPATRAALGVAERR